MARWIKECCEPGSDWIGTMELYASWKNWSEAHGEFTGSVRVFSIYLEKRGWVKRRNSAKTLNGFIGWKLKSAPGIQEAPEK